MRTWSQAERSEAGPASGGVGVSSSGSTWMVAIV